MLLPYSSAAAEGVSILGRVASGNHCFGKLVRDQGESARLFEKRAQCIKHNGWLPSAYGSGF